MARVESASPRRVLLLGANGMLGTAFRELLAESEGVELRALDLPELDLLDPDAVRAVFRDFAPETVVNCTGYTNVDGCEEHEADARALNGEAPRLLAELARERGALLVHFSTDYVFDGKKGSPYTPADPVRPLSAYGRTKLAGERAVLESGGEQIVARTAWIYAPWGRNFVRTILQAARERPELAVVDDQVGSPTYAPDLAAAAWQLATEGKRGLVQLVNSGETSWCGLAREIVRLAGLIVPVRPITTSEADRPAARPAYSVMVSDAPLRSWPEALAECVKRLIAASDA